MSTFFDRLRPAVLVFLQSFLALLSALCAFQIIYNFQLPPSILPSLFHYLLVAVIIKVGVYQYYGLNRGWWKYASISDMLTIVKASSTAHLILFLYSLSIPSADFPWTVMLVDFLQTLLALAGARMLKRFLYETSRLQSKNGLSRVLIVGAGDCGINLVRQIRTSERARVDVVGFVDDAPKKSGMTFIGLPVLGSCKDIPELCAEHSIDEVYVSIPSLSKKRMGEIVDICTQAKVKFKTVPSTYDILHSGASLNELRPIEIEDLLDRDAIRLSREDISRKLQGKTVLVTGGGGSIGSELCRQILSYEPRSLIVLERSEYNLFKIEAELRKLSKKVVLVPLVADLLDPSGIRSIFSRYRPQLVFHAAAHKHVNLMEGNAREAIRNNIFGTKIIAETTLEFSGSRFVMISTDKAVRPKSIMGYSKRAAELVIQNIARQTKTTQFISVRFGNVLGSSGSVVEIFRNQLTNQEPLTVTSPDATRFFITCHEAVELILQAATHGHNGEIYMLDMGKPVSIYELAKRMIQLSDPLNRYNHQIQFTGLRPGEKLCEELYWSLEDLAPSPMEKIFRLKTRVNLEGFDFFLSHLLKSLEQVDSEALAEELKYGVDLIDHRILGDESSTKRVVDSQMISRLTTTTSLVH